MSHFRRKSSVLHELLGDRPDTRKHKRLASLLEIHANHRPSLFFLI